MQALKPSGFTLIELMIVIAIIGILSTMAIPTYQDRVIRTQVKEALILSLQAKENIAEYYQNTGQFPADNQSANLPVPEHLIGNYVTRVSIENGSIHITLGNRINALVAGKILTLRPAYVSASPASPIAWLCGYAEPVTGMQAFADNQTNLAAAYLAPDCRSWQTSPKSNH